MADKLVITRMKPLKDYREAIVSAYLDDGKMVEVHLQDERNGSLLKSIYVGKVKDVVKNIHAAFIEIEKEVICYYSLDELQNPVFFINKRGKKPLAVGDELLVQVVKEGMKKKFPVVSTNLSFSGKYLILTTERSTVGVSNKIDESKRQELKAKFQPHCEENLGIILRTNAKDVTEDQLLTELTCMKKIVHTLLESALHLTCFSKVYEAETEYLANIRDSYVNQLTGIVTDDKDIYKMVFQYLKEKQPEELSKLTFYEDSLLPVHKLYHLQSQIQAALKMRIWLKSGAYLLIEQTEAFVVIDVNTGKFDGKNKRKQETFLKTNEEAAKEIARQLRLRNLSGIILIDFISMKAEGAKEQLLHTFSEYVKRDPVKTEVVDMTSLGIVEVTRKKEKRCLQEAVQSFHIISQD